MIKRTNLRVYGAIVSLVAGTLLFATSVKAQNVDLDEIFRCIETENVTAEDCDQATDLILNNCTTCHNFAPIVVQQFTPGAWQGLFDRHRDRVRHLSDEQVDLMRAYLSANFNEELPPPEVPAALLADWTDY